MKKRIPALLPYFAVLALAFYLLPALIRDTGSAMLLMLLVFPAVALGCGAVCGVRQGFAPLLTVGAALLFTPTVFLFYNSTAWVYIPGYAGIVFLGNLIGCLFYSRR